MAKLSNRLNRLATSATLAMSQKSAEMKAQGIDVINLSVGEPDFNTPDDIKAAAKQAVDDNWSRYSPVPGYADLRRAIVAKLKNENHLDYTVNEILVSNGAKQCVCNAILALVDDGEEVIIPAPYWVSYPQMALLAGGKPVIVPAGFEQNFKITPEQLEAAITPQTRMLILCSPSNPTGSVYSREELQALAEVILRHDDLYVLADEIYEHIIYIGHHESIAQFPGMKERTIVINGVSKAYAMTGWRIGFMAAPEWIVKGCNKLQDSIPAVPVPSAKRLLRLLTRYRRIASNRCVRLSNAGAISSLNWPARFRGWRLTVLTEPSTCSQSVTVSMESVTFLATPSSQLTTATILPCICSPKRMLQPWAVMHSATPTASE